MHKTVTTLSLLSFYFLLSTFYSLPDLEALKREAAAEVDRRQALVQQMVDQIFSYSELGFHEYETSKYVTGILEKNGFRVERGVAGMPTAWVASWGSGKPVIAFMTDIDCIPRASQKPGVAYHDPIIEGAPGHGEGHNSGMAVNVTAALVLRELMAKNGLSGTLRIFPGVAEELVGAKAFFIRAGLFIDLNKEKMEHFAPLLKKYYFDSSKYKTYLEQLGIQYPTVRKQ